MFIPEYMKGQKLNTNSTATNKAAEKTYVPPGVTLNPEFYGPDNRTINGSPNRYNNEPSEGYQSGPRSGPPNLVKNLTGLFDKARSGLEGLGTLGKIMQNQPGQTTNTGYTPPPEPDKKWSASTRTWQTIKPETLSLKDVQPIEPATAPAAASYSDPGRYTPSGADTVRNQISGLLAENSPYMQLARKSGERMADARGLLNSGLSSGYAQKAAIESAFPIASQDARARTDAGMQWKKGQIDSALATQRYGNDANLVNLQTANSSRLSKQEAQQRAAVEGYLTDLKSWHDKEILDINHNNNLSLTEKEAEIQRARDRFKFETDKAMENLRSDNVIDNRLTEMDRQYGYDVALTELDADIKERLRNIEIEAASEDRLLTVGGNIHQDLMRMYAEIDTDPNMTSESKTEVKNNLEDLRTSYMDSLAAIISTEINWEMTADA